MAMANNRDSEQEFVEINTPGGSETNLRTLHEREYQGFNEWRNWGLKIINICDEGMQQGFTDKEVPREPDAKLTDLVYGACERR
jgi:hypothetical protein